MGEQSKDNQSQRGLFTITVTMNTTIIHKVD